MDLPQTSEVRIAEHFEQLAKIGNLGPCLEDGFLRAGWSDEESAAMGYIRSIAVAAGFDAYEDSVGNLYLRSETNAGDGVIQIGSHLDTVPRGGLFDGGAGIVAGLEAMMTVAESKRNLSVGMELVIWRSEESATWKAVCIGSRAALGLNPPQILNNSFDGKTLKEAILAQGFDPAPIQNRKAALSDDRLADIRAHLELHIEQSIQLESNKIDIGIVSSIRGTRRRRVVVHGEAAHSGGTPMGTRYRSDANLAIAYMQTGLDLLCSEEIAAGADLVQTVGVINSDRNYNDVHSQVYENALTKVSPFGYFTLDYRSNSASFLSTYDKKAQQLIQETSQKFNVVSHIEEITELTPIESLDSELQEAAHRVCTSLSVPALTLASGALHDAAIIANQKRVDGSKIPTGMLFIPCRGGVSHNPLEFASAEAVKKGADVLAGMIVDLYSV